MEARYTMWVESGIITKRASSASKTRTTATSITTPVERPRRIHSEEEAASSVTLFSTAASSSEFPSSDDLDTLVFPIHPDDPHLYQIPSELHPIYRPLPVLWQVSVWFLAALMSASLTFKTWADPMVAVAKNDFTIIRKMTSFLIRTLVIALLGQTVLQDKLVPPTRISTQQLIQQYVLPSTLSKYESVPLVLSSYVKNQPSEQEQLGVHYIQYPRHQSQYPTPGKDYRFQALYLNHGFGASSLSWLPVLPSLVDRLRTRVGLGHDAVGFGFTQRPSTQSIEPFTPTGSASIGTELLRRNLPDNDDNKSKNKPILLMGHSMGSLATLQMALTLPPETRKWIVLVAPALGMRPSPPKKSSSTMGAKWRRSMTKPLSIGVSAVGRYTLKRLVG
jgi:predicted esterase